MTFILGGETFNVRTDRIDKVERSGYSLKIIYLDGKSETWSAKNSYQFPKINTLEIILKALEAGYKSGLKDYYRNLEDGEDDYFPCSSDSCEDYGPGGYSPVD